MYNALKIMFALTKNTDIDKQTELDDDTKKVINVLRAHLKNNRRGSNCLNGCLQAKGSTE